ncbi:MAG: hypothetical protein Q7N87_03445 [Candidatus Uhrbacteria bacterium]|nr:hypothetical protein [Candidatus Uhrbacteria bacterium]
MFSLSSLELLYFISAIAIGFVAVFLCWALYEIATLVRQTNEVVSDTREKVARFERAIMMIGEKLGASAQYLGFIAEGGKQLLSYLHKRSEEKKEETDTPKKHRKKREEEELSEMGGGMS